MTAAPIGFQLHGLATMFLFVLWPFTCLVHGFSAPVGYLTRPHIVYRCRDDIQLGSHTPDAGGIGSDEPQISATVRPSTTRSERLHLMQKSSLAALAREQLELARAASSGRSASTVYGGHEHVLRQTMIALTVAKLP